MATRAPLSEPAERFGEHTRRMLIDGEWVDAVSGKTFESIDPATERPIAQVAHGEAADVDRAVRAARRAFDDGPWRRMSPSERGQILWRTADLMEKAADELAALEALDNGKPVTIAKAGDVALSIDLLRYMAGWATKIEGNTKSISAGGEYFAYTLREPIGVVGQIIPWNFPLLMASWKVGPALAAGCTLILKPAEQTPLTALRLGELFMEAGMPAGVVNIVPGFGDAGAALAAHPQVDKIAFTGSTEVGRSIVRAAADTLKKVTLELGGKSPNVVFADADLDAAIAGAAAGIFFNTGQSCSAGSRLYVESRVFDAVVEGVAAEAKKIRVGSGLDPESAMGPLISREQFDRVSGYVQSGLEAGAHVSTGGRRVGEQGFFMEPTILTNVTSDMKVVQEEIFGPVVTAVPFDAPEDVLPVANETIYGLAAGVWTRDISKAHRVAARLQAGTVWVNTYQVFDASLPFGGYKQSGWGREMGHEALENYLETKAVCIDLGL